MFVLQAKHVARAKAELAITLAPMFGIDNPGQSVSEDGSKRVVIALWELEGGVRIAEIGERVEVHGRQAGSSLMRGDVLNGGPGCGLTARLFLACESWLVGRLWALSDDLTLRQEGASVCEEHERIIETILHEMKQEEFLSTPQS